VQVWVVAEVEVWCRYYGFIVRVKQNMHGGEPKHRCGGLFGVKYITSLVYLKHSIRQVQREVSTADVEERAI